MAFRSLAPVALRPGWQQALAQQSQAFTHSLASWRSRAASQGADAQRILEAPCCGCYLAAHRFAPLHQTRDFAVKRGRKKGGHAPPPPPKFTKRVDSAITAPEVRLVGEGFNQIVPLNEALAQARADGMQLVEVDAESEVPTCRIMKVAEVKQRQQAAHADRVAAMRQTAAAVAKVKGLRLGCASMRRQQMHQSSCASACILLRAEAVLQWQLAPVNP
jgi:Translation initiation factor IF-3, N-terminal domain